MNDNPKNTILISENIRLKRLPILKIFWIIVQIICSAIVSMEMVFRYFKGVKSGITYVFFHNYARIKVDSYDSLPLEITLTFHNVITRIK